MAPCVLSRRQAGTWGRSRSVAVAGCAQPRRRRDASDDDAARRAPRALPASARDHPQLPAEALMHSLADVHRASGRAAGGVNMVLGLDNSEEAWRKLDSRVHSYPYERTFTAIGSGGPSFRRSMVAAVQAVVGHVDQVTQRSSTGGRYISVTVGPVIVSCPDDVVEVYQRMKTDGRLRYFL